MPNPDHCLLSFSIFVFVGSRGLDVPDLVCVINYSCPNHLEDYVHRVGRTGRAGRKGTAYTFISAEEDKHAPTLIKALTQSKQKVLYAYRRCRRRRRGRRCRRDFDAVL